MSRAPKSQAPAREQSALEYARGKNLSLDWVYRQLRLGKIPSRRVDGKWVITEKQA